MLWNDAAELVKIARAIPVVNVITLGNSEIQQGSSDFINTVLLRYTDVPQSLQPRKIVFSIV